jgi:hypothetical protein
MTIINQFHQEFSKKKKINNLFLSLSLALLNQLSLYQFQL